MQSFSPFFKSHQFFHMLQTHSSHVPRLENNFSSILFDICLFITDSRRIFNPVNALHSYDIYQAFGFQHNHFPYFPFFTFLQFPSEEAEYSTPRIWSMQNRFMFIKWHNNNNCSSFKNKPYWTQARSCALQHPLQSSGNSIFPY